MHNQFTCSIQDASNHNRFRHFVIIETHKHLTVCFRKTQSGLIRITHICHDWSKTWPKQMGTWHLLCHYIRLNVFFDNVSEYQLHVLWRRLDKAFFRSNCSSITLQFSNIYRLIRSCVIPLTTKAILTELTHWSVAAPWVLLVEQPQSAVTLLQIVLQRYNILSLNSSCLHDSLPTFSVWHIL